MLSSGAGHVCWRIAKSPQAAGWKGAMMEGWMFLAQLAMTTVSVASCIISVVTVRRKNEFSAVNLDPRK